MVKVKQYIKEIVKRVSIKVTDPLPLKKILLFLLTLPVLVLILVYVSTSHIYSVGQGRVYRNITDIEHFEVGIVFGAGVKPDGSPHDMLYDRLQVASEIYHAGKVDKLLVSGDNSTSHYNEPIVMKNYLVEHFNVPEADVVMDYAGLRTYDTCIRAKELWNVSKAILITQGYHLPRAINTCVHLGIDAYGYSATLRDYLGLDDYKFREILAIQKSLFDLYIISPDYISGEKELPLME